MTDYMVNIFTPAGFIKFIQLLVLLLEFIYLFFAFLLVRQVKLMNKSLNTPLAGVFTMVARIHFFAAVVLVALSILIS